MKNNRMFGLMGMGWDMGPPFWPYQAIYLLLFTINAPAFVLSMPILKLLDLQTLSLQYGVWFPAIYNKTFETMLKKLPFARNPLA